MQGAQQMRANLGKGIPAMVRLCMHPLVVQRSRPLSSNSMFLCDIMALTRTAVERTEQTLRSPLPIE
jgi:hypothetical protein